MRKEVAPIKRLVEAKPHRPVYRMHRYFARRPYTLFAELVRHYTQEGELVLDPFCGGGVVLVESQVAGRRAIGYDVNPLATFVSRKELEDVDLDSLRDAQQRVIDEFQVANDRYFSTDCRRCGGSASARWFEHSAVAKCGSCSTSFRIAEARKEGIGKWACPVCGRPNRFSPNASTDFAGLNVAYSCQKCDQADIAPTNDQDLNGARHAERELARKEAAGLWIPNEEIPDCNMQRESALFKKGIRKFRQLFTARHLLALGILREVILRQQSPLEEWLLFCFSSTLRYTNRMVTRNPSWRGERPLEWAKPGFWLPPVHLEANVLEEFSRRCEAVHRGKRDARSSLPATRKAVPGRRARDVLDKTDANFYVGTGTARQLPLPDECIDAIITDPPYGSYVHYADLCNFWSVWLPEVPGLGGIIEDSEEAVIARKRFPGAKTASDYQRILEGCFVECARVLKASGYMVLTFHNREPRAWAALLLAAVKAGFGLPPNGIVFQSGVPSYRHTAQSRRAGSVIGDFVLTFKKTDGHERGKSGQNGDAAWLTEEGLVRLTRRVLKKHGPLTPDALLCRLYLELYPRLGTQVRAAVAEGDGAAERLIEQFDKIRILDSHRRQLLEQHFAYSDGMWRIGGRNGGAASVSTSSRSGQSEQLES